MPTKLIDYSISESQKVIKKNIWAATVTTTSFDRDIQRVISLQFDEFKILIYNY